MIKNENAKANYKYWFLTINNPNEDWRAQLQALDPTYCIGQLEKGENGTPHIQALVYYATSKRPSHWKGISCWSKGISAIDAQVRVQHYCSKQDTRIDGPFECGKRPSALERKLDYGEALQKVKEGKWEEVNPKILIQNLGNLQRLQCQWATAYESPSTRGVWIHGKPGFGKTHFARHKYPNAYIKSQNKWWDGYIAETSVILDDLDEGAKPLGHHIKIWADKWPCTGEIKGAQVKLQHKVFCITSNYLPEELWSDQTLCSAIRRRFIFILFVGLGQYVTGTEPGQYPDTYQSMIYNNFVEN